MNKYYIVYNITIFNNSLSLIKMDNILYNDPPFKNLHTLLPTPESRILLSIFLGIPITKINNWLDPDRKVVPKADELVLMAKYFDCTVDYLLDLSFKK